MYTHNVVVPAQADESSRPQSHRRTGSSSGPPSISISITSIMFSISITNSIVSINNIISMSRTCRGGHTEAQRRMLRLLQPPIALEYMVVQVLTFA